MKRNQIHCPIFLLVTTLILNACTQSSVPTSNTEAFIPTTFETPACTPVSKPVPTVTISPVGPVTAERIPIIQYHNPSFFMDEKVMCTPKWFNDQIDWLFEQGYRTLSSADLVAFLDGEDYPQKSVVLSFDIGTVNRTEYSEIVIPALRDHGFHAIFFMVMNDQVGDDCNKGEYFCWDELRAWVDEGLISIESHGIFHQDYRYISREMQEEDARISKQIIEEETGREVLGFAYPYDGINEQATQLIRSLGYQYAVGGYTREDRSVHRSDPDRYRLPRIYPYSNPQLYPALSSAGGLTFEELIQAQTEIIQP